MAEMYTTPGMGWLPDYPSFRDFTISHEELTPRLEAAGQKQPVAKLLSRVASDRSDRSQVDLREWFSPIDNQGLLNSCTAHAGVGLVEYFERKAFGKHIDASRLFLWKVTRNLLHWTGNSGAFSRTAMGALVLFGVPPEEYWPYDPDKLDVEPPAFCYAFAQEYQAIQYYRLDPPNTPPEQLLQRIKDELVNQLPCMFGFTVYRNCLEQSQKSSSGMIPMPVAGDKIEGGHAVIAAGFDDKMTIRNTDRNAEETEGAILVRNSWGEGWGEGGYGWLPYQYVLRGLTEDWWSLIKAEWVDTGQFGEKSPA